MADEQATIFCKWEKQRYPATEFRWQGESRVHAGSSPLHTVSGRKYTEDPEDIGPLGDVVNETN